ncbi:MAG: hypothetical protein AB7P04_06705 [Bacteriovoracia bacterium]
MKPSFARTITLLTLVAGSAASLSACSGTQDQFFAPLPGRGPRGNNPVSETLRSIKPALAVRGISCLMCHATIQSDVITDFGAGDPWFMGAHSYGLGADFYGNPYDGWASLGASNPNYTAGSRNPAMANTVNGSIIVPRVEINQAAVLSSMTPPGGPAPTPLWLRDFMMNDYYAPNYGAATPALRPAMAAVATPASGRDAVIEKDTMYIGAPTRAEILALAPKLDSAETTPAYAFEPNSETSPELSGLEITGNVNAQYLRNQAGTHLVCHGDLVVRGTVFLKNAVVETDADGCRLYATDSVFIQGPITYEGPATANLQISSARAIVAGFSLASLNVRLVTYPFAHMPPTRGPGSIADKSNAILADAQKIGADLKDAADAGQAYPYTTYTDPAGGVRTRVALGFEHVIFNAPQVHGRYYGPIHGVIIAEIALFAVGELQFQYDSIFNEVPAFPLLQTGILEVSP